ncbi:MAG: ATP-binding protein, partial [Microthrixaceae bacterium]
LAIPPEQFIGRTIAEMFPEDAAPGVAARFESVISTTLELRTVQAVTYSLDLPDGRHQFEARLTAVADDEVLALIRDTTNLHESERERLAQREQLLVQQSQLQRAELEREIERVRRSDTVGYMAATMAHDVNNLLGVVNNYASSIASTAADQDLVEDAQEIRAAVARGAALTRRLVSVCRHTPTDSERFDLRAGLQALLVTLEGAFADPTRGLVVDLGSDDVIIEAKPGKVERAVMNLVLNARDAAAEAASETDVAVSLVRRRIDQLAPDLPVPGEYAVVTVCDRGDGVDPALLDDMFEPFVTTKAEGTGLGLSIVRDVVRDLRGDLVVRSSDAGTEIEMWIPLADDAGDLEVGVGVDGDRTTVLVVDDDEAVRRSTVRVLRNSGCDVLDASSSAEALEVLGSTAVDVILCDVRMPGTSGSTLALEVLQRHPHVALAFVTGYPGDIAANPELADVTVLDKPYDIDELVGLVATLAARP